MLQIPGWGAAYYVISRAMPSSKRARIIKIQGILAFFWLFEDFCDFRFVRFGIPFDSIDIASEGRPDINQKNYVFAKWMKTV